MFLLQKILSDTSLKKIVAEQTSSSQVNVNKMVVEKEGYTSKLFEKLCVLSKIKNKKATKRLKTLLIAQLLRTFKVSQICRNKTSLTDHVNKRSSTTF